MNAAAFPAQDHKYRKIEDADEGANPASLALLQGILCHRQDPMTIPQDMPFPDSNANSDRGQQYGYFIDHQSCHSVCPNALSAAFVSSPEPGLLFRRLSVSKHVSKSDSSISNPN